MALGKAVFVSGPVSFWIEYELDIGTVPRLRLVEDAGLPAAGPASVKLGTEECAWRESSFLLYRYQNVGISGKYWTKVKKI